MQCLLEIMRDEEDAFAHGAPDPFELVLQLPSNERIKGTEGFVHQQDARIGRKCASEADALLHSSRKLVGIAVAPAGELDKRKLLVGNAISLGDCDTLGLQCVAYV